MKPSKFCVLPPSPILFSLPSFFLPSFLCVCMYLPSFLFIASIFYNLQRELIFFSVRVVSKLLLIFYKETIFWNTSYTIFLHFSLLLKCWQCVGCEHGGIVAFECCKVNAENDSLNGIIKVDVGNIWMPPSLLCRAQPWFLVLLPCTFSGNLTAYHFLLSPHFQHELRGLVSIWSYNLWIGGRREKCTQFSPKRLFPGSEAVSSVSSLKDIKHEKVTIKLLPVYVLGEPQRASLRAVLGTMQKATPES